MYCLTTSASCISTCMKCGIDPTNPDRLLLGNDEGFYCSWDRGKDWHSISNHLPTCAVYDLAIQERGSISLQERMGGVFFF